MRACLALYVRSQVHGVVRHQEPAACCLLSEHAPTTPVAPAAQEAPSAHADRTHAQVMPFSHIVAEDGAVGRVRRCVRRHARLRNAWRRRSGFLACSCCMGRGARRLWCHGPQCCAAPRRVHWRAASAASQQRQKQHADNNCVPAVQVCAEIEAQRRASACGAERSGGHRHVLALLDVFTDDDHVYLVLELAMDTLGALQHRGPGGSFEALPPAKQAEYFRQIAEGAAWLARQGIMHGCAPRPLPAVLQRTCRAAHVCQATRTLRQGVLFGTVLTAGAAGTSDRARSFGIST